MESCSGCYHHSQGSARVEGWGCWGQKVEVRNKPSYICSFQLITLPSPASHPFLPLCMPTVNVTPSPSASISIFLLSVPLASHFVLSALPPVLSPLCSCVLILFSVSHPLRDPIAASCSVPCPITLLPPTCAHTFSTLSLPLSILSHTRVYSSWSDHVPSLPLSSPLSLHRPHLLPGSSHWGSCSGTGPRPPGLRALRVLFTP